MIDIVKEAADYQVDLFDMVGEFWGRATGIPPEEFSSIEEFGVILSRRASDLEYRIRDAFTFANTQLREFYAENAGRAYRLASRLAGTKLVLGGSSSFGNSELASTRSTLLYADTVLIADPIYPWFEDTRRHERFRYIGPLAEAHAILHLRPLVTARLPHCPVFVFPSFEKTLEREDETTKQGIRQLVADIASYFVDPGIHSIDDACIFARDRTDDFIRAVERHSLFVPPGGFIGEPVKQALGRYDSFIRTWRTSEYTNLMKDAPVEVKVLNGMIERLGPQYHLFENAEELAAHPLLSVEQQGHFFKLVSRLNSERLSRLGLLDDATRRQLAALSSERLEWLDQVPISLLSELRQDNEHEAFRKMLSTAMTNLHATELENVDKVAAEICREIDSGIARYNRSVREINDKFKTSAAQTLAGLAGAGLAALVPNLAPFFGPITFAAVSKLGYDAVTRHSELKKQSRSLIGVLAFAKDQAELASEVVRG